MCVVYWAKMLASEEAGLVAASLRNLRSMTDLALRAQTPSPRAQAYSNSPPLEEPAVGVVDIPAA